MAATPLTDDVIAKLAPGGSSTFAQLSDDELLANTRQLVGRSNQLLAALLAHLAEVETRGVHRSRRCASLYTYCVYELRLSEDAAARRSAAARFAKEFPTLLDAVAAGELHLTGLLMIGPHLTPANQVEVLARAKFRTKKELAKLVRELNPVPEVPDRIEPLGPEHQPMLSARNPSWEQFAAALSPQVRELPAGEQPGDWANDGVERVDADETLPVGPVPSDLPPVTGPQLFQLQFSTVEEHVQLVERAKALLARKRPRVTLGELHLEAMKLLVAALEKRKFAVTERPRNQAETVVRGCAQPVAASPPTSSPDLDPSETEPPRQRVSSSKVDSPPTRAPRQRVSSFAIDPPPAATPRQSVSSSKADPAPAGAPRQSVSSCKVDPPPTGAPRQSVSSRKVDSPPTGAPRQRVSSRKVDSPPAGAPRQSVSSSKADPAPTGAPRQRVFASKVDPPPAAAPRQGIVAAEVDSPPAATPRQRVSSSSIDLTPTGAPHQRVVASTADEAPIGTLHQSAARSRFVPAGIRREVYRRDGARCTYIDVRGRRCCETHYLELHHLLPFAKGGGHVASNLTLRCAAHNALAAEADFGRRRMADRRNWTRHETLAAQAHK